jgi:hypothetical protein
MRSKWIQVRVSDDEHAALTRRAKTQGVSIAELVRTLAGEGSLPRRVQEAAQRNGGSAQEPREPKDDLGPVLSPQERQKLSPPSSPTPPNAASGPRFRCPDSRCDYRANSPAATCQLHGRKVVPA